MRAVASFVWFLIFEFIMLFFLLVITGIFSADGQPLQLVSDVAASIPTTVWDIGIGFFVIGTMSNLALLFLNIARAGGK